MDTLTRRELLATLLVMPAMAPPGWQAALPSGVRLTALDVSEIVAGVKTGDISVAALVDAYLQRIDRLNPRLGAYVTVTPDRARADAQQVQAARRRGTPSPPLAGVPIAHKDLFETAGIRTTAGSRLYERHTPRRDADIVRRLANAGSVMLGKTNTHELGGGVTTINPFFGTTHNPWNLSRIPGGSSGGSAAAVVAGIAAAATGSDTGGSVRIPAALCGCVGFKPTFGLLSTAGLLGACPTFDQCGLLTRTVADAELIFQTLFPLPRGPRPPAHRIGAPVPRTSPHAPVAPVRIGIARNVFFDALQPDVARAVETAIAVLADLGADVRDVTFPVGPDTMARIFDPIVVAEIQARFGRAWLTQPDRFSAAFGAVLRADPPSVSAVDAARRALDTFRREVRALFETVDIVVTPTVPVTAPPVDGPIDGGLILRNTWAFNAAGTPAISVPCGFDRQGLPIGLQMAAAAGDDRRLLQRARVFQDMTGWHRKRPVMA